MTLSRTIAKGVRCECCDSRCPEHKGSDKCSHQATDILYRVDMQDETGTAMCDACSDDAFASGLFTTEIDDDDDMQDELDAAADRCYRNPTV